MSGKVLSEKGARDAVRCVTALSQAVGTNAHGHSVHAQPCLGGCLSAKQGVSSFPSRQRSLRSSGIESVCPVLPVPAGIPPESSAGLVHLGSDLAAPRSSSKLAFGDGELRAECSRELSPGTLAISPRPALPKQGLCAQIQPPTLKAQGRAPPSEWAGKFPLLLRPLRFFSIAG